MINVSKILITDDEPKNCASLSFFLEKQGYETKIASGGSEALALLENNSFDLFMIDKQMPEIDGFMLMDMILKRVPEATIIIMTGDATVDSAVAALKKGAHDYLKKPFDYDDLIKTVKNALHHNRLKEENRAIAGRLNMSEKRYKDIVHNSPDLIYTLDGEGCFSFVNDTFFRLLGYDRDDIEGKSYLSFVHGDDVQTAEVHVNDILTGTNPEIIPELRLKCAFGAENGRRYLTVELKSSRGSVGSPDDDGRGFEDVFVIARDISYRKELEDQLRHAQKMEAIGTLAGGIAHDFNNLLMSIQGYASLLLNDFMDSPPHYKKLTAIEKQVTRGAELTRQLLGFARGGKYHVQSTSLNMLVRDAASMFGRTKKEIGIRFDLEKDIWPVEVDRGQIEQVLLNLFVNAWQAMPQGGDIEIRTENVILEGEMAEEIGKKPGSYVLLSVSDSGCGIDEETLKRIFDPFFTTKDRNCGTGLGLASVYGIITAHKGAIKVSSRPGLGSIFSIYLGSTQREIDVSKMPRDRVIRRDDCILLVDDEPEVLGTTKEMLENIGLKVIPANSGESAVKFYMENCDSVDLVILDLIMPGVGGGDTFDYIREINPEAKIILSSGYSRRGEAENIIKRGCNGFIQKPYSMARISEMINDVLGPAKMEREDCDS